MGARWRSLSDADGNAALRPARRLAQRAVLVPEGAVQRNGDTGVVFVVADGNVEKRTVRLGDAAPLARSCSPASRPATRVAIGDLRALRWHRVRIEN